MQVMAGFYPTHPDFPCRIFQDMFFSLSYEEDEPFRALMAGGLPYAGRVNLPRPKLHDEAPTRGDTAWTDAVHGVQEAAPPLSPTVLAVDVELDWGSAILAITDEAVRFVAQRGFHKMARVRTLLSCFQNEITGFTEVMGTPADDTLPILTTATKAMTQAQEAKAAVALL